MKLLQLKRPGLSCSVPVILALGISMIPLTGCGPSQEELMMRAARRKRPSENEHRRKEDAKETPTDDQEIAEANTETDVKAVSDLASVANRAQGASEPSATEPGSASDPEAVVETSEISLLPIDQRKPSEPLNEAARALRAIDNIQQLSTALQGYFADTGRLPSSYSESSSGLPTLSWRVRMLPYLGHEDLYNKFDFDKPWNIEPNKSLIAYIPDAFVSPERFDTNTNYLFPTGDKFLFADNRTPRQKTVEDGMDSTLMLFEVNDSHSVPWTKPADFAAKTGNELQEGIGDLRPDATLAIWANGLPLVLGDSLTADQLFRAATHESGDGLRAGDIHRDLEIDNVAVVLQSQTKTPNTKGGESNAQVKQSRTRKSAEYANRTPIPKAGVLADAQRKLRDVYASQMRSAKTRTEKDKLARDLLKAALQIPSDPSGAYALQTAAMRLAADSGNADTLMEGIDQRVAMFAVAPYDENISWLLRLRKGTGERDSRARASNNLMNRAVRVAHAGIDANDFARASEVVGLAYRFNDQHSDETLPSLLNRLRMLLSAADREFSVAVNHLDAYRKNPEDAKAAAAFGRFLCFIKGDWENGLPLLAKDESVTLSAIAQADLDSAFSPDDQAELGDRWWDLGERAKPGVYQQAARDRAVYWYSQAYESMPDSLDRIHVKNRMDKFKDANAASPIAVCRQLGDELGLHFEVGLGEVNARRSRRSDDDDDD
ncbi:MAG: DUF1559 domain-containing protein [Rubripirellula sp.]